MTLPDRAADLAELERDLQEEWTPWFPDLQDPYSDGAEEEE